MVRLRPLLSVAPLLAAFAACATFGTSSDPKGVVEAGAGAPPPLDAAVDSGPVAADAEPDTRRAGDAEPPDGEPPDAAPTVAKRLVFVTAEVHDGAFAVANSGTVALAQADALCATSARGLPGLWVAYLSSPSVDAPSRLPDATEWYLPGAGGSLGPRVFASRADIPLGPEVAIDVTAAGTPIDPTLNLVWTGTDVNGVRDPSGVCGDWRAPAAMGRVGEATSADLSTWSSVQTANCAKSARIYCFQR